MKGSVPVLDVLFPSVRTTMLRLLFCSPPRQRYVRELTSLSGLALCTVQDELRKMSVLGLVTAGPMAIGAITRLIKGTRSLHLCFASYEPVNTFQPQNMSCCTGRRLCEYRTSGRSDV